MNNLQNKSTIINIILNTISIVALLSISYEFYIIMELNTIYNLLGFIIPFSFFSLISTFIFNNFKYSNNKLIKLLQKIALINIILIIILLIFNYFDIQLISEVFCDGVDDNNSAARALILIKIY